ncbi:MAG: PAS domain S-box protein, partial [Thermomicrobiales bacterium]|nr:PAS domain S-box protein [Thermomicrobiales bacterium]
MNMELTGPGMDRHALLEALHGRLPYGVAVFDDSLRLVYANAPWSSVLAALTGRGGAASPGSPLVDLLPAAADLHAAAKRSLETGAVIEIPGHDLGDRFWDITVAPTIESERATGVICVAAEATNRIRAEHAAEAKVRLAAFRADVSQALASSDEVDAVLRSCAGAMVRHARAVFARIWVLDETEDLYRLRASEGLYTSLDGTYARIPADWIRRKIFSGHTPVMAVDILRTHEVRELGWAAEQGLVAWASHPLMVRGQIVGFMVMFAREDFDSDTLGELAAVADAIAQFLERKRAETALREREVLFRSLFETAADGLMISDLESGQVLEANPAICAMHGYSRDEMTRLGRADLVHPDARDRLRDYIAAMSTGDHARAQLPHLRKDGATFHADVQGNPILYQGRPAVFGVVRDVTQEREAHELLEQRVAERTRELKTLLDMSRSISLMSALDPLLHEVFEQMRELVDYESVAIGLAEGDWYTTVAVRRDEIGRRSASPIGTRFAIDRDHVFWQELAAGRTLYTPNVAGNDDVARGFREIVGERIETTYAHVCSLLAAPLMVANELLGAVFLSSVKEDRYRPHDIGLIGAIASQIAVAVANTRLHEQA